MRLRKNKISNIPNNMGLYKINNYALKEQPKQTKTLCSEAILFKNVLYVARTLFT